MKTTDEIPAVRHILSLSGGKDSAALAVYMRDRVADMEYVFCDTGEELPETYEFLDKLEAFLGRSVVRLNPDRPFMHHLSLRDGYLPSAKMRWCTENLKLKPFEKYIGTDNVVSYIGIRADEDRKGYVSHKPNITSKYPFVEDGIVRDDVIRILEDSGLGLPRYYTWRSRSGCYFCFFQQKIEWVGLKENHPDLYEKAKDFERSSQAIHGKYTWSEGETLEDIELDSRIAEIRTATEERMKKLSGSKKRLRMVDVFDDLDEDERACLICDL